ncbi:hypothetical protein F511_16065 [Dorcoceras hygrometricum]|uniref:Dystroglycan-like n=1 Tax=Dorcoceras hygrometricum TaxID=472368 RepID=A0A2Z7A483_9LAMI|nr:hypothetical protein F511_16065 [Dorcoceras hygrometricum]
MASSLVSNTNQVHFASVLAMDNEEMVAMFEALVASGLNGFLGCMSDIFDNALIEFYQNASVQDGKVVSTFQGKLVEISEDVFARTFQMPMEGLIDIHEVPKDLIFDARTEFSFTGEQLTTSCKKRELKIEYRLLSDIVAKSITVKAGSFDAVTHERFLLMTAIFGVVSVNWGRLLFKIFKDMVTPETRQARGYAVHICILLKNIPDLELGDSEEFPPLKILTAKTVGRYIAINDKIVVDSVEVLAGKSRMKKTPVKRAASKKSPAVAIEEQVVKKKRTLKGKAAPSKEKLDLVSVALDADPIQTVDPTSADDVDTIIEQVVSETTQTDQTEIAEREQPHETDVREETVDAGQVVEKADEIKHWFDLYYEEFIARHADRIVESASETDEEQDTIPGDMMLPSVLAAEPTKIKFGLGISIPGVAVGDLYKESLPKIALTDKGKAPLVEAGVIKGHPAREMVDLIFGDIEFLIQLREHVIVEVSAFFNSFSLRRLAFLTSLNKDIAAKEENVLTWAETDSVQVALHRKVYILDKYREMLLRKFLESHRANFSSGQPWSVMALQIIDLLSDAHSTSVKHLLMQRQAHGLQWTKPCFSMLFEDVLDCGFYIPRNHKIFVSTCWLRLLRRIGDVWVVEDGYDRWVYEDETPVSQLLVHLPQRTSLESLAPICLFFQPVQCLSASTPFLLKLGVDIIPTGPILGDFSIPRRVVDNVSYRIQILDSALPVFSAQISPVVDISSAPIDFVPSSPHQSSSSASSMHLTDDIPQGTTTAVGSTPDVAQFSLPSVISESFNDLRASMSRIISNQSKEFRRLDDSHNEVLDKIKQLDKTILDAFYQQNQVSLGLIKGIRQEARNDRDAFSLGLKAVHTKTAILSTDQADARKEAKEQKAIIADMDERLATVWGELLDFRAQAQENYINLSSQLGELVAYINRGNDKKGEEISSCRPQPPPDDLNRPSGGSASRGGGGGGSGGSGRRDDRRGSSTKRG